MIDDREGGCMKVIGAIVCFFVVVSSANCWGNEIEFDGKNYSDNGEALGISGTMKGDGVTYKNNTYAIWCMRERRECFVSSIAQIGPNLMGRLDYPFVVPIVRWTESEIMATEDSSQWACFSITIIISRKSRTASWLEESINPGKGTCDTKRWIHRWSIE
jgi:hypothetical protein